MQMPTGVVMRRTADLVPYANNARTHTPEPVRRPCRPPFSLKRSLSRAEPKVRIQFPPAVSQERIAGRW
jgi:hypothetical protein